VRFFGKFEAVAGGVPVPVQGAKQRTILALLAHHRGKPVSADRLIDALWGDGQVANPVNALQAQIGQLRRTLGATAILTSDVGYALDIGPDDVDAARFEQLVAKGRRLLEEREKALASTALGEALRLRRGEPLTEFACVGFADDWFVARGDADAALSLASGMARLWSINSGSVEGAHWPGGALGAKGSRRPELAATAHVWHGYCVCMAFSSAAGVLECETATAALSTGHDRVRRAEALVLCAHVLMRTSSSDRSTH
jgi:hypothetical protein